MSKPLTTEQLMEVIASQQAAMTKLQAEMESLAKSKSSSSESNPFTPYFVQGSMILPDKANTMGTMRTMCLAIKADIATLSDEDCNNPKIQAFYRKQITLMHRMIGSNHTPFSRKPEVKTEEIAAMESLIAAMIARKLLIKA